tara:strand:+ start:7704 stop:8189 length:486 start_codon:yes stop_codon:yes gene_type:complete
MVQEQRTFMNPLKVKPLTEKFTSLANHRDRPLRTGSWQIAETLSASFYYAFRGIAYGFASQRNFRIQVLIGVIALSLGIWLDLNIEKLSLIIFAIALVLTLELINTSIEAAVDLSIGQRFHPLARIAKDCAAGAVLISSIVSLIVAFLLLLPPLLIQLGFQ